MYESVKEIRVRYGETDQMGYVYYGNYALYYEEGRTDAIRKLGLTYKQLEALGIILPVAEMTMRYKAPALYDDVLTVKSTLRELPGKKMKFYTDIYNEKGEWLNTGETTLLFIKMADRKICNAPEPLLAALRPFFEETPNL
jgi:acyl-CoA thioester hydrolase